MQSQDMKLLMPVWEAGWTTGMAGPLRLKDLCCSEEQSGMCGDIACA